MKFTNTIQSIASSYDTHFKNLKNKPNNLEKNFNVIQIALNDLHTELSQVKQDKLTLDYEYLNTRKIF